MAYKIKIPKKYKTNPERIAYLEGREDSNNEHIKELAKIKKTLK